MSSTGSRGSSVASSGKCIGLAGLGYWGKNILRNLYEMGVLRTACDADLPAIDTYRQKYPDIDYTSSFSDLLADREIKGIVLATPAVTHYELVKRSLEAGKDVLVEKPLALTVPEGERLVEIADANGRILMVGHILQYHPAVKTLKSLIASGGLGKIQYIYSNRLNIGKLRTEENILWSFAPHDISLILDILGKDPTSVTAMGGYYLNKDIADTTITTMEFGDGVIGHIFVSWLHPYKEQKLIVVGSKAMVVFDDVSTEKLLIYPHEIEWREGKIPIAQKADCQTVPIESGEPLRNELDHFVECVESRRKPLTDGVEGLRVLKVLDAAEKSLQSKRETHTQGQEIDANVFIHESAVVDDGVSIGDNTRIWHFSHILSGSDIGSECTIGQNCAIGPEVTIGDRCKIQNNVSVYKGVTLEDEVFCGPSCVFTNVYYPRAFIDNKHKFEPTLVQRGATIGANASIVCGTNIGRYAMVGAGSVVKSDIPDHAIVAGAPAKQIGWACKCGSKLRLDNDKAKCEDCGNEYLLDRNILKSMEGTP